MDLCPAVSDQSFKYEPQERFGASMTSARPWNYAALDAVERLNGRAAMIGFTAAVIGELITGNGVVGQLKSLVIWYLNIG